MNTVILSGHLTKNIELRYTKEKQIAITDFSVGVYRKSNETDFIRCKAFDKDAENLERMTKKGDKIWVKGRLQVSSYEKDGETRYLTEVIVDRFELMTKQKSETPDESMNPSEEFKQLKEDVPF